MSGVPFWYQNGMTIKHAKVEKIVVDAYCVAAPERHIPNSDDLVLVLADGTKLLWSVDHADIEIPVAPR